tara:strand:+ start:188 stop:430 length:243 start_codon:yes stop_codon:yes gene_type:complete
MNGIGPRLDRLIEIMNDWNFKFTSSDRGGDPSGMYLEHYSPNLESELNGVANANQNIADALERIADVMENKTTDDGESHR